MWYAGAPSPRPVSSALTGLARGVSLLEQSGDAAVALPLVSARALAATDVADVARYYTAVALQRLNRLEEAESEFAAAASWQTPGALAEMAALRHAEVIEARGRPAAAADAYAALLERPLAAPQAALLRLASSAAAAGDSGRAIDAARRVRDGFLLSPEAAEAERVLEQLKGFALDTPEAVARELERADALFRARRWAPAQAAYERARGQADGAGRERIEFRLAQIEATRGQHRSAREVFRRYVGHDAFAIEAAYGLIGAAWGLGEKDDARQMTRDFAARHPTHALTEAALTELARRYILDDEDGEAAAVYADIVARFPSGALAERAYWKAGWWAYREKDFRRTITFFEQGARAFPRSDYRPSWLYWSARAYDELGDRTAAIARYRLAVTDYRNSYYGRLAWQRLESLKSVSPPPATTHHLAAETPPAPPNAARITRLIELGLFHPALAELQYAQRRWGDSPRLIATIGLVHNRLGNLRLGINAMRRAYPQFLAAGGEALPVEILQVIYPIDYWPLLKGHAQAKGLDPYIVAALVAQESTFDAQIRSSANAIGLMQILPSTGRRYARRMGIRPFSERSLTMAETNVRIGTQYFGDLVNRFGASHLALASYNAGEHRVQRWLNETPDLPQDEFIDNIPFPETQNYVKRILGTAEDYRRLYGEGLQPAAVTRPAPPAKKASPSRAPTKKSPPAKSRRRPPAR
jgi:soluble lytic murein transglycosylase